MREKNIPIDINETLKFLFDNLENMRYNGAINNLYEFRNMLENN